MSLSDFATFSTAISGLTVTVSLVYLALQTHQNAKHTKALIFQGRADRISNQFLAMANPELASAWLIGNGRTATSDELERRQFDLQCVGFTIGWRDTFTQHEEGLINSEFFEAFRMMITQMLRTEPGLRQFVQQLVRDRATSKWRSFIAEIVAQSGVSETEMN